MEAYLPFLQQLASFGAYGYTIISVLYYINQAAKNVGYIKSKWVLALTGGEAIYMVLTAYFWPLVFMLSFAVLAMTAAVVQYHDAMKDKAGGGGGNTAPPQN